MDSSFQPSEELLKLQAVELDIFKKFRDICHKHGLRYYADAGTLLGAIRHNGFIPWDDDMDVIMMWDDCLKFREIAAKELEYPYFYLDYQIEDCAEISNIYLKRLDTTAVTKWEYDNIKTQEHHRGISIDIFPAFAVPDDEKARLEHKQEIITVWRAIRGWNAAQNLKAGYPTQYMEYLPDYEKISDELTIQEIKQKYMDICAKYEGTETEEIGLTSYRSYDKRYLRRRSWYEETIEVPFADTTVTCPKKYDEILTVMYGDWRTPSYDGAGHEMYIIDTETPYSERMDLY